MFTATDGDQPAGFSLYGTPAALTIPPITASLSPGILGRIRTRSAPRLSSDVFCRLHPHPWLQTSRALALSLRICGSFKHLQYTEYMPWLFLATKQLFLDGGLVHSGGRGQGKEGQSASRWPRNADPEAPATASHGCVTLSKWPHLSDPAHSCGFSVSFRAHAAQLHNRGRLRTGSLEEPSWSLPSTFGLLCDPLNK